MATATQVGEKAARIFGGGELWSDSGVTQWYWRRNADGQNIRLGATLNEAWRNLNAQQQDRESPPDKPSDSYVV